MEDRTGPILDGLLKREGWFGPFTATRLAAMGRYVRLIDESAVADINTPVLFVRPETLRTVEPGAPQPSDREWRASWDTAHTVREVSKEHFVIFHHTRGGGSDRRGGRGDPARTVDRGVVVNGEQA